MVAAEDVADAGPDAHPPRPRDAASGRSRRHPRIAAHSPARSRRGRSRRSQASRRRRSGAPEPGRARRSGRRRAPRPSTLAVVENTMALNARTATQVAQPLWYASAVVPDHSARTVLVVWWITCLLWSSVWLGIKIGVGDVPPSHVRQRAARHRVAASLLPVDRAAPAAAASSTSGLAADRGDRLPAARPELRPALTGARSTSRQA